MVNTCGLWLWGMRVSADQWPQPLGSSNEACHTHISYHVAAVRKLINIDVLRCLYVLGIQQWQQLLDIYIVWTLLIWRFEPERDIHIEMLSFYWFTARVTVLFWNYLLFYFNQIDEICMQLIFILNAYISVQSETIHVWWINVMNMSWCWSSDYHECYYYISKFAHLLHDCILKCLFYIILIDKEWQLQSCWSWNVGLLTKGFHN